MERNTSAVVGGLGKRYKPQAGLQPVTEIDAARERRRYSEVNRMFALFTPGR